MTWNKKRSLLCVLLLGLMICGLRPVSGLAAGITQSAAKKNSITVRWADPYADSDTYTTIGYELRYTKYSELDKIDSRKAIKLDANRSSYTLSNLKPGTKYCVRITYYYVYLLPDGSAKEAGPSSMTAYDLYTLPGKVKGVNQTKWYHYINSAYFAWDKQDACKYQWRVTKNNGNSFAKENEAISPSGSISNTSNTAIYKLRVRAYVTDPAGKKHYGDWSDTAYLFGQPMLKSGKVASGKLTVKWDKVTGMTHYRIYVSTKKDKGYKLAKTVNASKGSASVTKFGNTKIKNNGTYYVYIVGVKKVGSNAYTSGLNYTWEIRKNTITETRAE